MGATDCASVVMLRSGAVFFADSSPDFVNGRGWILNGTQQVDAYAQAQSIYFLSILITQCFNVRNAAPDLLSTTDIVPKN